MVPTPLCGEKDGTFTTFDVSGSTFTAPTGISADSQLGSYDDGNGTHGFERENGGTLTTFGCCLIQRTRAPQPSTPQAGSRVRTQTRTVEYTVSCAAEHAIAIHMRSSRTFETIKSAANKTTIQRVSENTTIARDEERGRRGEGRDSSSRLSCPGFPRRTEQWLRLSSGPALEPKHLGLISFLPASALADAGASSTGSLGTIGRLQLTCLGFSHPCRTEDLSMVELLGFFMPELGLVFRVLQASQFAVSSELAAELAWRLFSESAVRTTLIVSPTPQLNKLLGLGQVREPVSVEAFRPQGSIEHSTKALSVLLCFADDFVVSFQFRQDVDDFQQKVRERFAEFGLELARRKLGSFLGVGVICRRHGLGRPETLDLGFKHVCAVDQAGRFALIRLSQREELSEVPGPDTGVDRA